MGNCCRTESPCGSVEERCVLLNNDAKAAEPVGEMNVEGTCGPEDDDIRKIQKEPPTEIEEKGEEDEEKRSPENEESSKTQENGPLMKESIQSAAASLCKELKSKRNSAGAQDGDVKEPPVHGEQPELLQTASDSPQKTQAATIWEVFTEADAAAEEVDPAAVKDGIPEAISAESSCPEEPSLPETTSTAAENITASSSHEGDEKEEVGSRATSVNAGTVPSENLNGEVFSVPNSNLAADVGQVISKPVVNIQEASSCAVTRDSDNGCLSLRGEDIKGHDVSESPPGPQPARGQSPGRDHGAEEPETASSVRESVTTDPADASERSKPDRKTEPDPACSPNDFTSSENIRPEDVREAVFHVDDAEDVAPEKVEGGVKEVEVRRAEVTAVNAAPEDKSLAQKETEIQEVTGEEEQLENSSDTDLKVVLQPVTEKENLVSKVHLDNSEEDLYRAAEELSESQHSEPGPRPPLEITLLKVEDRCSLDPAVDILSYSEREWKGNTAKSALIRKGYKEMSLRFGSVRRVRGDNYCALRATLFQVLSHSSTLPLWLREEDGTVLLKQLQAEEGLISRWTVPGGCLHGDGTEDVTQKLRHYMELLKNKWQAAVDCSSAVERQQLCERIFQGGEEELGLLEALKLLMLVRAVELHRCMQGGSDVPLFCWLLFARDTSDCPRSFLSNHLSHVGLTAGLEQVEMFLLGYALQCTIQVYRLYKADTEEFLTYYPDDHKDDWPSVCLVTEDDRHYNVPVAGAAAGLQKEPETS